MRAASLLMLMLVVTGVGVAQPTKKGREPVVRGKTVAAWVKDLSGKEVLPRVQAISALRAAGPEARRAVPALIAVFRDKDATFLHPLAAEAMARVGPDAVTELQKALADKDAVVRGGAALALGMIGEPARAASADLGKTLEDRTPTVRFAAAQALGRIGGGARPGVPALRKALADEDSAVRVESASALWKVAGEAKGLEALKKGASGDNATVAGAAIAALGEMGTAAKDAATTLKAVAEKDKDALRRIQAAEAWYRVSKEAAAVAMIEKELHRNADVRKDAIAALGTLGAEAMATRTLIGLLDDKDTAIRREAACALTDRGVKLDAAAGKVLLSRLGDADPGVRWWCALALAAGEGEIRKHDEEVLRALRVAFQRVGEKETPPWTTIQEVTASANGRATPALIEVLKNRPGRFKTEAAKSLALLALDARPAQTALLETLSNDDKLVTRAAADALGQFGVEAQPALTRLLSNANPRLREGAARALGQMGLPARAAVKTLTNLLKDDDTGVRTQAALALWSIDLNAEVALPALNLVLKDVDYKDRWEAVEAVGIIASEARPVIKGLLEVLLEAAKDRDPRVKTQGAAWLFRRSGKARETVPLLRDAVTDRDSLTRLFAIEALGEMGAEGKVVELLSVALDDKDVTIRLAAESALARGGKEMVPDLIAALKNPSAKVRAGVARALGLIGPPANEAVKPLIALKEDKDASVRAAVAAALLAIFGGKEEELKKAMGLLELRDALERIDAELTTLDRVLRRVRSNPRFF